MNRIIFRTIAIVIHALINIILVSYLTDYDITGNWLKLIGFVLVLLVLLALFTRHIFSFIHFIKSR